MQLPYCVYVYVIGEWIPLGGSRTAPPPPDEEMTNIPQQTVDQVSVQNYPVNEIYI